MQRQATKIVCRGLVSDDENSQVATNDAFEVLHFIASKRLATGERDTQLAVLHELHW